MGSLQLIHIDNADACAEKIAQDIQQSLDDNKRVAWLLSGGSSIEVAVMARKLLDSVDPKNLTIGLIDERYGEPGHANSNWQQLVEAGFDFSQTTNYPVLCVGKSIEEATEDYSKVLQNLLNESDVVIGLLGMGPDGHTAGLLPGNPLMDSEQLAGHFQGPDFARITVTPKFIGHIDEANLYAVGTNKYNALESLLDDEQASDLPVLVLRESKVLKVYTDYERGNK